MPFKSEKQRRYLWAEHPEIAKRWAEKYPQSNKGLPMYAHDDKDNKTPETTKQGANLPADVTFAAFLTRFAADRAANVSSILSENSEEISKKADSKQERVSLPRSEGPVYAGQERAAGKGGDTIPTAPNINDCRPENAINSLLQKISVVLAPAMAEELERRKADAEGRIPQAPPKNVNLKPYPVNNAQIAPPMGTTPPPQPAQPPAQPTPTAAAHTGMHSPSANPIQSFGPLSVTGNINGNAAFGAKNSPDSSKTSAAIMKWAAVGLWDRIRAKKQRGEKPAKPGDKDYPDAKSWKKVTSISEKQSGTPAWQRSEGKNSEGGLNEKGRKSYEREHGGNLKAPVTEKNPKGKAKKRQNSFCARMCGMKRVNTGSKTKKDPDSRINKSLRKWNCKCGSAYAFGQKMAAAPLAPALVADLQRQNQTHQTVNRAASLMSPTLLNAIGKRLGVGIGPALSFGASLGHAGVGHGLNTQRQMLNMFQPAKRQP